MILVIEGRAKTEAFFDEIKLALFGHDPDRFRAALFPVVEEHEVVPITEDETLADTAGEWRFENTMSGEEIEDILAGLPGYMEVPSEVLEGADEGEWK